MPDGAILGAVIYWVMYGVGLVLCGIYCVVSGKIWMKRDKTWHILTYYLLIVLVGLLGAALMAKIQNTIFPPENADLTSKMRLFGALFIIPIICHPIFYLLGLRATERLDIYTPAVFIFIACAKAGCHFAGCCYGIPCSWGVKGMFMQETLFPVQLFETASIFFIVLLMIFYSRSKFFRRGTVYPITTLLYACNRIAWEFLRYYAPGDPQASIMLGLNFWQTVSLLLGCLCIIWLIFLPRQMKLVKAEEERGPEISIFKPKQYIKRWKLGFTNPGTLAFSKSYSNKKNNKKGGSAKKR